MKENSVNFAALTPSKEELELFYRKYFSYPYARAQLNLRQSEFKMNTSTATHAKVLFFLESIGQLPIVEKLAAKLRATYNNEVMRLGINSTPWGKDDTWIYWDIAKQLYYYLNIDRSEISIHYRIANPLEDKILKEEIVSRHIGWEYLSLSESNPWANNLEVQRLLQCMSTVKEGEPSSWALTQIGAIMRSTPK